MKKLGNASTISNIVKTQSHIRKNSGINPKFSKSTVETGSLSLPLGLDQSPSNSKQKYGLSNMIMLTKQSEEETAANSMISPLIANLE